MKAKGMFKRVSCMALAGVLALSGQALATDTRAETLSKLEQVNTGTIMADKVLKYGSNYDLRNYEYLSINASGSTNSGWAIVASKLLELNGMGIEYSAKHMDYATATNSITSGTVKNAHNRTLGNGGNMQVALGYLTSGKGPVSESDLKWDGSLSKISPTTLNNLSAKGRLESYKKFKTIYKMTYPVTGGSITFGATDPIIQQSTNASDANSITQVIGKHVGVEVYDGGDIEQNREEIKEHIIKYGAVSATIYRNGLDYYKYRDGGEVKYTHYDEGDSESSWCVEYWTKTYIPRELTYYCTGNNLTPNHDVVIIGWDDEKEIPGAPGRGAYLVMDTDNITTEYYKDWDGEDWHYRGYDYYEDGIWWKRSNKQTVSTNFYYVSYYDYYIESNVYGIKDFSTIAPSKIYQYDHLGMSTVYTTETSSMFSYGANVFARNTTTPESLNSISIASVDEMKYEVYVNPKSGELSSSTLIKVAETDVLDAGYNTIYFDDIIMLTGQEFVVAVKYISLDPGTQEAKIGVQSPTMKSFKKQGESTVEITQNIKYWENAKSASGRSWTGISLDNWTNMYEKAETKNMVICIKAFTTEIPGYQIPTDSIQIQKMNELGAYVDLENDTVQVLKGDQIYLGIKATPDDAANKTVSWSSSNKNVATVDNNGVITTVGAGKVTITAKLKNAPAISAQCTIDVRVPIDSFVLNKNQVTILAGETNVLAGIIGPEDATTTKIEWTSSNKNVVKVTEDGLLIGLQQGSAIVTAIIKDEAGTHTATCKVTVPESLIVDVLGVSLNKTSLTLEKGTRETLKATVTPADATNTAVVWTSSNKNVAIVNANGRITALSEGTAVITVTTVSGGETATCNVTVIAEQEVAPTGITLNQNAITLEKDAVTQLVATVTPNNAVDKTVIWSSSNLDVVRVSTSGKVTAIDEGTAEIIATTANGAYSAKCTVTITKPVVRVTGISINKTALTLEKDLAEQLIAAVEPANADNTNITWTSNNANIVTVDESGLITAVGYGEATITATTANGGYTKTCIVSVPQNIAVTGIELSAENLTVKKGRTVDLKVSVLPTDATNANYTYTVSEEEVVEFMGNGIKGLKAGEVTITFKTEDGEFTKSCTITVEDVQETEIDISSDKYIIDDEQEITAVSPETTVEDFKHNIKTDGTEIVIKDKDGNPLEDTDMIGTGATIEISKEIETTPEGEEEPEKITVTETLTIKVTGDLNGDGMASSTDLSLMKRYIMEEIELEGIYLEVADLNGDGEVSLTDLSMIKQQIVSDNKKEENE